MTIVREEPPFEGDERSTLIGFLDYHRTTLAMKCEGLSDEQLRLQSSPPSTLSLLGLVRHMAEVERHWFQRCLQAAVIDDVYPNEEMDGQASYDATGASVEEAFANWEREIQAGREVAQTMPLEATGLTYRDQVPMSLRCVLVHMIEEYARHNGHADFLREAIDGATGE